MTVLSVNTELTPAILAEVFWGMNSIEQADFFLELAKQINGDSYASGIQWYYLAGELGDNPRAKEVLMSMAAPLYLHTLQYIESK